jgi:hypothetical protein
MHILFNFLFLFSALVETPEFTPIRSFKLVTSVPTLPSGEIHAYKVMGAFHDLKLVMGDLDSIFQLPIQTELCGTLKIVGSVNTYYFSPTPPPPPPFSLSSFSQKLQ